MKTLELKYSCHTDDGLIVIKVLGLLITIPMAVEDWGREIVITDDADNIIDFTPPIRKLITLIANAEEDAWLTKRMDEIV